MFRVCLLFNIFPKIFSTKLFQIFQYHDVPYIYIYIGGKGTQFQFIFYFYLKEWMAREMVKRNPLALWPYPRTFLDKVKIVGLNLTCVFPVIYPKKISHSMLGCVCVRLVLFSLQWEKLNNVYDYRIQ